MPLLSIITVNYNNATGLQKTLQSVFAQTFTGYEYIIIDGGSTDRSKALIGEYADRLAYWVSEKDNGVYDAMNKGISIAKGNYTMFLNSGDFLLDENVLLKFSNQPVERKAAIYYGNMKIEAENNTMKAHTYPPLLTLDFWEHYTINHQASFIKTLLFKELGLYDTGYTLAADYAFFLKCFVYGKQFEHIDHELVYYKSDGLSSVNSAVYQQQMKQAWNSIVPAYVQVLYKENKDHALLMKHRLMSLAKNLQNKYSRLKSFFN
ncbi:MAG: glycosyltransferase family 2 protein [Ferruginibacter sp.]